MERTGQRLGPGTHTQEISLTCAHTPSHLTDVTLARKAHSLTETFSGYERTISENDEEQLLLAQRFDLAPVLCGINGMVAGGAFHVGAWPCTPCALPFYILLCFTSVHPTLCCGAPCMYSICMWRIFEPLYYALAVLVCVLHACGAPPSAKPALSQRRHTLTRWQCNQTSPQEPDIMIAAKCAN